MVFGPGSIALVGSRGAGRTTQAGRLQSLLGDEHEVAVVEWEGVAPLANDLAAFFASKVNPLVEDGHLVLIDGFAHDDMLRRAGPLEPGMSDLRQAAMNLGAWPDLVLFLDVPAGTAAHRLEGVGMHFGLHEVLKAERSHAALRALVGVHDELVAVNGVGLVDIVTDRIQAAMVARLPQPPAALRLGTFS